MQFSKTESSVVLDFYKLVRDCNNSLLKSKFYVDYIAREVDEVELEKLEKLEPFYNLISKDKFVKLFFADETDTAKDFLEQVFLETKPIRGLINCCFYDQEINLYEKSFDKDRIKKFIDHEAMFRGSLWNFISLLWNDHSGLDKAEKVHTNFMIFVVKLQIIGLDVLFLKL